MSDRFLQFAGTIEIDYRPSELGSPGLREPVLYDNVRPMLGTFGNDRRAVRRVAVWTAARLASMLILAAAVAATASAGEPISIVHRGTTMLPAAAVDQHGLSFDLTGLSGITHRGGALFTAVMDNSNKLLNLDVRFAADGSIASVTVIGGVSLAQAGDYEAIAYTNARLGTIWLADEGAPRLDEFDLATGQRVKSLAAPPPFDKQRAGFGWESLARRPGGAEIWTANEEALAVDGGIASPTAGTTVRLLKFISAGETYAAAEQYVYQVDPWHAGDSSLTSAERSGLVELVLLPDGTMLALERSLAFNGPISPSFRSRLYQIDFAGATNVADVPALAGQTFTPLGKQLLWSGFAAGPLGMNLEGLSVGPRLANGNLTLVGIVDDGGASDPLSNNVLVAFEITSPVATPSAQGDANLDGRVDREDVALLASTYGTAMGAQWEDADFDGDGRVSVADLALLARGFPVAPVPQNSNAAEPTAQQHHDVAAPEPNAIALIAAAAAMLLVARWMWRRFA